MLLVPLNNTWVITLVRFVKGVISLTEERPNLKIGKFILKLNIFLICKDNFCIVQIFLCSGVAIKFLISHFVPRTLICNRSIMCIHSHVLLVLFGSYTAFVNLDWNITHSCKTKSCLHNLYSCVHKSTGAHGRCVYNNRTRSNQLNPKSTNSEGVDNNGNRIEYL